MAGDDRRFGERYDVLERIGAGAFSEVYRARDRSFGRRIVALKALSITDANAQTRRRFERECEAAGRVSMHPNIVAVYDRGFTAGGEPYIVLELCLGGSLMERLAAGGPLAVPRVLGVGVQIATALQFAHDQGVLHRDVKPENILIKQHGAPALSDFGIAKLTTELTYSSETFHAFTAVHAAPEMLWGNPTARSDVYSLTSTLYQLLAGHAAFTSGASEPIAAMLNRIVASPVPPLVRADVGPELMHLIAQGMAKEPSERPSAGVLARALADLEARLGGEPVRVLPLRPPSGDRTLSPSSTPAAAAPPSVRAEPAPPRAPANPVPAPAAPPHAAKTRPSIMPVVLAILVGIAIGLVVVLAVNAAR